MKPALLVVPVLAATLLLAAGQGDKAAAARAVAALTVVEPGPPGRYCVDFTPYVTGFAPGGGPEPSPALVGQLLHELLADGRVKCIFTYGSFGAYGFVPSILRSRAAATGVRTPIIMNLWLDVDAAANSAQIGAGIALARAFPDIIVAVSCGSEIRLRHNRAVAVPIILDCLARLRAAGIPQPLTHQATWPEWCDEEFPGEKFPRCLRWEPIGSAVDLLLVTAYSWWENQVPGRFPCITPTASAAFLIDRLRVVAATYPEKPTILSEFGWPGPPEPYRDPLAEFKCAAVGGSIASTPNKYLVATTTLRALAAARLSGILFSSNNEPWKGVAEGAFARFWGFCSALPLYACDLPAVPAV